MNVGMWMYRDRGAITPSIFLVNFTFVENVSDFINVGR